MPAPTTRAALLTVASLFALAASAPAAQAQLWGTDAAYSGTTNLMGSLGYNDMSVSWNVTTTTTPGLLQYTYTFSGYTAPAISHLILGLTDGTAPGTTRCTLSNGCLTNLQYATGTTSAFFAASATPTLADFGPAAGNPGFPAAASFYGAKFEPLPDVNGTLRIRFLSNRLPVWGDVYAKGGSTQYAYNAGLANRASTDVGDFVARPDGVPQAVVPEPATYAMLGVGLLGIVGLRRRRSA